mmetsp:Transcript_38381/g.28261  ORF Transcript_38381/g.28261 Transcript_38381/m.28261 type:complete len:285 (+) Transcript_38381:12-866(+)
MFQKLVKGEALSVGNGSDSDSPRNSRMSSVDSDMIDVLSSLKNDTKSRSISGNSQYTPINACTHYPYSKCYNFHYTCCSRFFPCQKCHDSTTGCPVPVLKNIACRKCNARQEPSSACIACQESFGNNFCAKCNIWTDNNIYHCEFCGICRLVTQGETFRHCIRCDGCFPENNPESIGEHECRGKTSCCLCAQPIPRTQRRWYFVVNYNDREFMLHLDCPLLSEHKKECNTCRPLIELIEAWDESCQLSHESYRNLVDMFTAILDENRSKLPNENCSIYNPFLFL